MADHESERARGAPHEVTTEPAQSAQSRPSMLAAATTTAGAAVVQRKLFQRWLQRKDNSAATGAGREHEIAEGGLQDAPQSLPHLERIQQSFGPHDIRSTPAFVGGAAETAADKMGAEAYATRGAVAFRSPPDLHTAAHEAAHVVQQRQGVHLKGGAGESGDPYEQQADRVADRVVQGLPAGDLLGGALGSVMGGATAGSAVQKKDVLPSPHSGLRGRIVDHLVFGQMWSLHPHSGQEDTSQNTSSPDVLQQQGLSQDYKNTCAIRMSTMLNGMGWEITPAKVKEAGIERPPEYSHVTKKFYILTVAEMALYLTKHFRKPDRVFPERGAYKNEAEFQAALTNDIKPVASIREGIVLFDKIFTYSGTGHADLFSGMRLSDSDQWYPSEKVSLWYVVAP